MYITGVSDRDTGSHSALFVTYKQREKGLNILSCCFYPRAPRLGVRKLTSGGLSGLPICWTLGSVACVVGLIIVDIFLFEFCERTQHLQPQIEAAMKFIKYLCSNCCILKQRSMLDCVQFVTALILLTAQYEEFQPKRSWRCVGNIFNLLHYLIF